jgi:PTS system mannose-specific IIC component
MSIISIILVIIVAFLAGMEGILDEFQFHQPLVACTLIGLVTGHLEAGIILGGTLQMIALGWANIGAAVAPDAALASVASAIILVKALGSQSISVKEAVSSSIAIAVPLAVAGLFLTMIVRTLAVPIVHMMDSAAEKGNIRKIEALHVLAVCMQGVRIAIPAGALLFIPAQTVQSALESMPAWLTDGMAIGGGMVVAVGYALVINMMATKEVWPFFIIGFVVAAISQLTLIALGALGVALALIYLNLSKMGGSSNNGGGGNRNTGDPLDDILNDY